MGGSRRSPYPPRALLSCRDAGVVKGCALPVRLIRDGVATVIRPRSATHAGLRLCESGLELLGATAVDLRDRVSDGAGERRVDQIGLGAVIDRNDPGRTLLLLRRQMPLTQHVRSTRPAA